MANSDELALNSLSPDSYLEEPANAEQVPLFGMQLQEVILWQLDAERVGRDLDVEEPSPDINWSVEVSMPVAGTTQSSAKINLDYRYPLEDAPAYTIHVELISLFTHPERTIAEGLLEVTDNEQNLNDDDLPPSQTQWPMNEYTIITLVWPYMRELVHQVQLRMRVPIFLLPTLDVTLVLQKKARSNPRSNP
jgi:hypothetical protein